MTIRELLTEATRLNLSLTVDGDAIRVTPAGQLPEELRQALRKHKADLIALLRANSPPPNPTPARKPTPPEDPCRLCNELPPGRPDCRGCKAVRIQKENEAELRAAFGPGGYRRR